MSPRSLFTHHAWMQHAPSVVVARCCPSSNQTIMHDTDFKQGDKSHKRPNTTRQWRPYELERDHHQMRPFFFFSLSLSPGPATQMLPPTCRRRDRHRDASNLIDDRPRPPHHTTPVQFPFPKPAKGRGIMASRSHTHPPLPLPLIRFRFR
jgi:hypothetical protein